MILDRSRHCLKQRKQQKSKKNKLETVCQTVGDDMSRCAWTHRRRQAFKQETVSSFISVKFP